MKSDRQKLYINCVLTVLMVLVGIAITLQLRTVNTEKKENSQSVEDKIAAYEVRIKELEEEKAALQGEFDRNSAKYTRELTNLAGTDGDFYSLLETYDSTLFLYENLAGLLSPLYGDGIRIIINDAISRPDQYNSLLTVHDTTLLLLVNELKAAGANAISINGERFVPMTEILCVGPAVRVNGKKLFPPYEIDVWGDTETLDRAIRESAVYQAISSRLDIRIEKALDGVANSYVHLGGYNRSYKKDIDLLKVTETNPVLWRRFCQ